MGDRDFDALVRGMNHESFSNAKLDRLRGAAANNYFTVDQVIEVIKGLSFSNDKVEAAAIMHDHTVDRANWYRVYDAFEFGADREKLRKRVGE